MWGSSFADLAKKAQALQEQASSMTTGDLFNLDSMQSMKSSDSADKNNNGATSPTVSTAPSFTLPSLSASASPPPSPKLPPPAPKGKLVVPSKKSPKATSKKPDVEGAQQPANYTPPADDKLVTEPATNEKIAKEEGEQLLAEAENEEIAPEPQLAEASEDRTVHVDDPNTGGKPNVVNDASSQQEYQKECQSEDPANTSDEMPTQEKHECSQETQETNANDTTKQIIIQNVTGPTDVGKDPITEGTEPLVQSEPAVVDLAINKLEVADDSHEISKNDPKPNQESGGMEPVPIGQDTTLNGDPPMIAKQKDVPEENEDASNQQTAQVDRPVQSTSKETNQLINAADPKPGPMAVNNEPHPEVVKQQFTAQLQRLQASFEEERKEMQMEHKKSIEAALAAKDDEMAQLHAKVKEKDTKVRELLRIKEGNELRLDSLKREVEGTKQLLSQRHTDVEKFNETSKQEREEADKKLRSMELDHGKTKRELKRVEDELAATKKELGATNDDFNALKLRVKTVAGELKDRRAEVRTLNTRIEELEQANEKLEEHISSLDSQISDRDRSGTEKDEEVSHLRSTIESLEREVAESKNKLKVHETTMETTLAGYKRKAQNSLSVANARAAAAIQAKEEAELEARAARTTADAMMEKAIAAEASGKKAMMEAKEFYREMEEAKNSAISQLEYNEGELGNTKTSLAKMTKQLEGLSAEKDTLAEESRRKSRENELERQKIITLEQELQEATQRANAFQHDIANLRVLLQSAESKAAADAKTAQSTVPAADDTTTASVGQSPADDATSKATIMMLQDQLREKSESIEELKELLENALASEKSSPGPGDPPLQTPQHSNGGKENGAPLFYAIEKQAELNTARNEINRLASLYSDVQSEKFEAQEALEAALRELDEEKAKSQRYEKLSSAPVGTAGAGATSADGRTNIEYLKNIMLSFLNAQTLAEKKALIPVIGAVLCLTPDEQTQAIKTVESTGSIEGFGSALFETFGSRLK